MNDVFELKITKNKKKGKDYKLYGKMEYIGEEGLTFRVLSST